MDGSSKKVVELKAHGDVAEEEPARRSGPGTDEAYANERRLRPGPGGVRAVPPHWALDPKGPNPICEGIGIVFPDP